MKQASIERLGSRGEGIATCEGQRVYVPYALAGETVGIEIEGDHGRLIEMIAPSPDRIAPICRHFGDCGGCAVQTLQYDAYAAWKRSLVVNALQKAGLDIPVGQLVNAHGAGRRRVTLHARFDQGATSVGFMAARSHRLIEIDACPLLTTGLSSGPTAARVLAAVLATRGNPLDIAITETAEGLDIDLRGVGPLTDVEQAALVEAAKTLDLARLTNHGRLLALGRTPHADNSGISVPLPPGGFLQATRAGEETLARHVLAAAKGARNVADLFCGVGAFALPLARFAAVSAYDNNGPAIAALLAAAHGAPGLRPLRAETRDLHQRPLSVHELSPFDCVVFDPPRAGAAAQSAELAKSGVQLVIAVSCSAQSFCRDAAILRDGGYGTEEIIPIDQFRFSPHVELFAIFRRKHEGKNRRRRLLG